MPGTFAYDPPAGTVPDAGSDLLSVVFTPTNSVDYNSVTQSVSLTVSPIPLTVTANNATPDLWPDQSGVHRHDHAA